MPPRYIPSYETRLRKRLDHHYRVLADCHRKTRQTLRELLVILTDKLRNEEEEEIDGLMELVCKVKNAIHQCGKDRPRAHFDSHKNFTLLQSLQELSLKLLSEAQSLPE